ncbi:uroporphyrinogen decarboxylase family protein [Azotosporobacter soli]|uniref:uroporphyrinogen decarboxylase family protein n=1 Tax=Azotosporobacter soli TaxID=3055040 RepID=UPI0031FEA2F7
MLKRERLLNAFNNKEVDRVPVGFWFHFLKEEEFYQGLEQRDLIEKNIAAHKAFIEATDPDFVKIMSDGYFLYPSKVYPTLHSAADLRKLTPLGKDHPWIQGQVRLAKTVVGFLNDTSAFYNIFAPSTLLRFAIGNEKFIEYFRQDAAAVADALEIIAQDVATLSELIVTEAGAEGIYLSVQNPENGKISYEEYRRYITPSERSVLSRANAVSENNILHCCGYAGNKNDLTIWQDYEAKAVNWAVTIENLDLTEGKKLFADKAVIGGFDNRPGKLLHSGTKEEIESFAETIITKAGKIGVIIGADCTVPSDIELTRLQWVKDKVAVL